MTGGVLAGWLALLVGGLPGWPGDQAGWGCRKVGLAVLLGGKVVVSNLYGFRLCICIRIVSQS